MAVQIRRLSSEQASVARSLVDRFHGRDVSVEYLARYLSNPSNYLFVADADGEPVGFLSAHRIDRLNRMETQFFIYEIEVVEAYRRRGIGRQLMGEVLQMARQEGIEAFVFTNHSNAGAVHFYKSLGGIIENGDELMFEYRPK